MTIERQQTCSFCSGPNNRRSSYCTDTCRDDDENLQRLLAKREKRRERSAATWSKLAGIS